MGVFRFPSQSHNLATLRQNPLAEISGSLGDLGTLLPLLIALTLTHSIALSTTLVFTGVANILTGAVFGLPLPVQPMKAVAAVAIARSFTQHETAAAGLFVAAVIGILSVTGLLAWVGRVVPIPVVKGIQVGAGLSLVLSAGSSLLQPLGWTHPSWVDNLLWALAAFLLLLATTPLPRMPYALVVLVAGLALAALGRRETHAAFWQLWQPHVLVPLWADAKKGALVAGLGQVPLTTLNSVVAVTHLAADLLPQVRTPSNTQIGLSVAGMNLVGCWFGAMPVCHGSGGLAAQYRFGARSGASVMVLGALKLLLGLAVSERWLVGVLQQFPKSFLGVMVIAAGVELAKVGESLNTGARDLWEEAEADNAPDGSGKRVRAPSEAERTQRWTVMLITVAGLLAFKNDAVGFVAGLLCHWSFQLPQTLQHQRQHRSAPLLAQGGYQDSEDP